MKVAVNLASNHLQSATLFAQNNNSKLNFKSIYEGIIKSPEYIGLNKNSNLETISKIKMNIQNSKNVSGRELLLYQIQINEINLKIELLSKSADSAIGLVRKLQNPQ